jgi:tRNA(Ile)-lysidine synthase
MVDLGEYILESWRHLKSRKVVVACSGGVDSLTLLHVLKRLGFHVFALHINYNLRGEDSLKDKILVQETCLSLGIELLIEEVDMAQLLKSDGGNLQAEARKIRYNRFYQLISKEDAIIALGHHFDDQVETFYMHLYRNSGVCGLACMLPMHDSIWRPFLGVKKDDIRNYAIKNRIVWREDVSNASTKYTRNKWRNLLLPQLMKEFPNLYEHVAVLIDVFQKKQETLEREMGIYVSQIEKNATLLFTDFDAFDTFQIHELLRQLKIRNSVLEELTKLRRSSIGKYILIHDEISSVQSINRVEKGFFFVSKEFKETPELIQYKVKKLPAKFSKDVLYLDETLIRGELKLRYWEKGDRIKPIGLKGSKLISDIIKDAKLNPEEKARVLVLEDSEKILWCVGLCVAKDSLSINKKDAEYIQIIVKK